jgi:hypothetical protein
MDSNAKSDSQPIATCNECGKIKAGGKKIIHWICEDCKISSSNEPLNIPNKPKDKK